MSTEEPRSGTDRSEQRLETVTEVAVGEELTVQIVEERAQVSIEKVETGRIRVRTRTESVEQLVSQELQSNLVGVHRVAINRMLAADEPPPRIREEGSVTIIPVFEEILVVEKRLVLLEEVHVRNTARGETVGIPVTLRKQHALVERLPGEGNVVEPEDEEPQQESRS